MCHIILGITKEDLERLSTTRIYINMYATSVRNHLQSSLCMHLVNSLAFKGTRYFEEVLNRIWIYNSNSQHQNRL